MTKSVADYGQDFSEVERTLGLPPMILRAVQMVENTTGDINATSPRGAKGIMQVMPEQFDNLKKQGKIPAGADIKDPKFNILAGGLILQDQMRMAGGNLDAALAGYNGGNVNRRLLMGGRAANNSETANYVPKVRAAYEQVLLASDGTRSRLESVNNVARAPTSAPVAPGEDSTQVSTVDKILGVFGLSTSALAKSNQDAITAVDQATQAFRVSSERGIQAATDAGKSIRDLSIDLRNQELAKANQVSSNATAAGVNPNDSGYIVGQTLQEIKDLGKMNIARADAIAGLEKKNIQDNGIMEVLSAQFAELPRLQTEYNAGVDQINTRARLVNELNTSVQRQAATDALATTTLSADGVKAEANAKFAKSQMEVAQLEMTQATTLSQLSINRNALARGGLTEAAAIAQLESQLAYRDVLLANSRERNELLKAKTAQAERFRNDLASVGYTPQQFEQLKQEEQSVIAQVVATGRLGDNPVDAMKAFQLLPRAKISDGQGRILQKVIDIESQIPAQITALATTDKAKAIVKNQYINGQFEIMRNNPQSNAGDNPYAIPSPTVMAEAVNSGPIPFNPQFKEVLKTLNTATGHQQVNDLVLAQSVVAQIGKDGYSREQAVTDLAAYYKLGTSINNRVYNYQSVGLQQQNSYPLQIKVPTSIAAAADDVEIPGKFESRKNLFSTTVNIDMTNPAAMSSFLALLQAKNLSKEIRGKLGPARAQQGILTPAEAQ